MSTTESTHAARALGADTLCAAFQMTADAHPDAPALRAFGSDDVITWGEYADRVRRIAEGLHVLGVRRGDTVGLMMVNRPEFHLVDTAAMHLGATPFSIYNTSSPEQAAYLFGNADNRVVVCERAFLPTIEAASEDAAIEHVVVVDAEDDVRATSTLAEVEQMTSDGFDFEDAWRAVQPDDVLTLIYTSGTTGPPKGVQLTHASMLAQLRGVEEVLPSAPGDRGVSFLPSAHVADRWSSHYTPMTTGAFTTSVADPTQVVAALPQVRPTVWGAVPRVWEKIMAALQARGIEDPAAVPEEVRAGVRAKLGLDQVRHLVSGAAPIPIEVLEYFQALGLPICELWGMSEISCCGTINPIDAIRPGTVGKAIPGLEVRLADDGELLVRGEQVMKGYRDEPARTAEAIDDDGWLHTGDVATIDDDGYVTLVDRKKELIINAAGKNMSPANIEAALKGASPMIGQAICIGDGRRYNVALLVLDPDASAAFAERVGASPDPAELRERDDVQAMVAAAVEEANSRLSRVEQIKAHEILDTDWEPGGDELTPTMKLRRRPIETKYADRIDALYAG